MVKHTPDPWKDTVTDDGELIVTMGAAHSAYFGDMENTCGECHANAQLTAAAPDLLAALIAVTKWCELAFDPEHATYRIPDEVKRAHVAIAKATGEAA